MWILPNNSYLEEEYEIHPNGCLKKIYVTSL